MYLKNNELKEVVKIVVVPLQEHAVVTQIFSYY